MNMRFIINRFNAGSVRFVLWIVLWCVAIIAGIVVAIHTAIVTTPLLHNAISNSASLINLVLSSGFFLLLTGIALNRSSMFLACSLIFLTGISKGFVGMLIYLAFGSGAWLLRFALLFTGSSTTLLIWWLLFKHYNRMQKSLYRDCIFTVIFMCAIFVLDIFVISPIMIGLSI